MAAGSAEVWGEGTRKERMIQLVALAGPAEGALAGAILLAYGWLLIVMIFASIGLLTRPRNAAGIAVLLVAMLILLTAPWNSFGPVDSEDSDLLHFVRR